MVALCSEGGDISISFSSEAKRKLVLDLTTTLQCQTFIKTVFSWMKTAAGLLNSFSFKSGSANDFIFEFFTSLSFAIYC